MLKSAFELRRLSSVDLFRILHILNVAASGCRVMKTDLLVLGAGASGLMAALAAAGRGLSVIVLEASRNAGRKLAACGGGRANFTNKQLDAGHYLLRRRPAILHAGSFLIRQQDNARSTGQMEKSPGKRGQKGDVSSKRLPEPWQSLCSGIAEAHGCRFVFGHKAEKKIEKISQWFCCLGQWG